MQAIEEVDPQLIARRRGALRGHDREGILESAGGPIGSHEDHLSVEHELLSVEGSKRSEERTASFGDVVSLAGVDSKHRALLVHLRAHAVDLLFDEWVGDSLQSLI